MVEIPAATKEHARVLLMASYTVSQIERETGLSQQQINGVWTGLKTKGWVAREARIGRIGQPQPASGPVSGRASDQLFPEIQSSPTRSTSQIAGGRRAVEPSLLMAPSQQTITPERPMIDEYVVVSTVERRKREDPFAELWAEENQDLIRSVKRARVDALIAENERKSRQIRREMEQEAMAQRRAWNDRHMKQRPTFMNDPWGMLAALVKSGMDPGEAVRRLREIIDLYLLASLING